VCCTENKIKIYVIFIRLSLTKLLLSQIWFISQSIKSFKMSKSNGKFCRKLLYNIDIIEVLIKISFLKEKKNIFAP